ncbi:hypothetical protein [Pseudarthrobacter defluvii]|uniref:hypothetical protein n=1 Tax=Pseudarthrobacter defluvii TaxID=410837 RepID=UPI0027D7C8CA|nr:hypothetical protein [Pseudarthrobacter defluvii]
MLEFTASGVQGIFDNVGINSALARSILIEVAEALPQVQATEHPLGFAHLELTSVLGTSFRTRLHLWTQETRQWADELGSLHDHTWELNSAVLTGGLTDTYLEPRQTDDGQYGAYQIQYGSGRNTTIRLAGRWALDERGRRKVVAGETYKLPPRAVHRTVVDSFPTATLVIAREMGGEGPKVFLPGAASELPAGERMEIDPRWTYQALQRAIASLS